MPTKANLDDLEDLKNQPGNLHGDCVVFLSSLWDIVSFVKNHGGMNQHLLAEYNSIEFTNYSNH